MISTVFLAAHLWLMNVAAAAPLFAAWLHRRASRLGSPAGETVDAAVAAALADEGRRQAVQAMLALVIGSALGLVLAGVMWLEGRRELFAVLPQFRYKLSWAVGELIFFWGCMLLYLRVSQRAITRRAGVFRAILAILAATNLLYHFPPLLIVMTRAAANPVDLPTHVGPAEFRQLMRQGHVAALSVHFGLASVAVAGVELLHSAARKAAATAERTVLQATWQSIGRVTAAVALTATAAQMLVGVWVLTAIPPLASRAMLGSDPIATSLLGGAIVGTFALLHFLAAATFGEVHPRRTLQCRATLALIILLMSGTLAEV